MVIISRAYAAEKPAREIEGIDGARHLALAGRTCPGCGCNDLIGHGPRARTYRLQPVPRGKAPPRTSAYRVRCKSCRHSHTVLPPALGPHKRYVLAVIETAARALEEGVSKGRISASLFGVSTERIATWGSHIHERMAAAQRVAERLMVQTRSFRPPAALPAQGFFAYLQSLLGVGPSDAVLVALNLLFVANLPLSEPLLLYPPSPSGGVLPPCPIVRVGGMPFG